MNIGSRSQVKELLKKGQILFDGVVVKRPDMQVDESCAKITYKGKEYTYSPYVYYMMNKPSGIITATVDENAQTVIDLFKRELTRLYGEEQTIGFPLSDVFPVGRLDKDTVGLLLLTNDGRLAHNLLSPAKHVSKKYYVRTDQAVTDDMAAQLKEGVLIGKGEKTRPAILECLQGNECCITITEGKYHQVKRMFQAVGATVVYLKRLSMGSLRLDERLEEGQVRELTKKEVMDICSVI